MPLARSFFLCSDVFSLSLSLPPAGTYMLGWLGVGVTT